MLNAEAMIGKSSRLGGGRSRPEERGICSQAESQNGLAAVSGCRIIESRLIGRNGGRSMRPRRTSQPKIHSLRAGGDALHSESLAETDLHIGAGKVSRSGCLNMTVKQSE